MLTLYSPPLPLQDGLLMTIWTALVTTDRWRQTIAMPEPIYEEVIFTGSQNIPIYGWVAIPPQAKGTVIGTYGITGSLENQGYIRVLGAKAYDRGFAVILIDWRAHGKTGLLSPTLTSDGIFEGADFLAIGDQALKKGCPAPLFLTAYSLGGQLALWGAKEAKDIAEVGGIAVISPNLDSERSLRFLCRTPWGRFLEQRIARELKRLARELHYTHPGEFDLEAIDRANSIWGYDEELVIGRLGFPTVEAYYAASSPLPFLPYLEKPTLILYPQDDPMFDPTIVPDLKNACQGNTYIDLVITDRGGHVGYLSSQDCQKAYKDPDCWWAWNRVLDWFCRITDQFHGQPVSTKTQRVSAPPLS